MTGSDRRYLQVMRAVLGLLQDEMEHMEVDDDGDPNEAQPVGGCALYECPNCSDKQPVLDSYIGDSFICPACGKEYGFTAWERVTE